MSIETDLITYLNTVGAVTTLVGNRISMDAVPQARTTSTTDVGALPAITVHTISGGEGHHLTGAAPHGIPRVQLSVIAKTRVSALAVREALRNALQGFPQAQNHTGVWGTTTTVGSVVFESGPSFYDSDKSGGDQGTCSQPIDLTIWFKQPIPST